MIMQAKIDDSRNCFVERMLEEGSQGRSFYLAARKLASAMPSDKWAVADMFPGKGPSEVCAEVLEFYGGISSEEATPAPDVPRVDGGLGHFNVQRTTELLRAAKKSDSRVDGDPLAHLVRCYPEAFAAPVTKIYNEINKTGYWPSTWKTEHLTIIPKNPNPSGLTECRNISCTSIFSKILEGVVLLQLHEELRPNPGQYGGVPKCAAENILVDIWEKVHLALEGGQNAAVLLGVDYEKAFNRAADGSISLVRAFLEERRMTITIDAVKAKVPYLSCLVLLEQQCWVIQHLGDRVIICHPMVPTAWPPVGPRPIIGATLPCGSWADSILVPQ